MSKKTRFHCERLEDRQLLAADLASVELFEVRDLDDSPISSLATVFVDQNGDATLEIDLEDRKVPTINVFHVDDVEINGDGSAASPFNDIGTALTSLQGTVTTATLLVEPGLYTWGSLNEIGYNFNIIGSGTGSDPSAATIVTHVPEADPDNTFAAQFRVSRAYMEGITFDGNFTSGSVVDIRNAAALTIVDSEFKNAGAGDGINIINTAEVVVVGSTAHNNFSDGFSYTTGANPEAYMEVLEADVHSYANGQNGEWNSQGSTVHKNVDIVRVSSLYEDNPTNISDVANGKSWQIDVTSRNALSNDQGNQFLNFNISGGGTAWIVGGDFSEGTNSPSAVNANPGSELRYVSLFGTLDPATHTVTGNVVLDDTPLVPVGSGEPTEVSYDIGNLGSGIVGPDTLNGIAYVMYSDQNVHARFVGSSLPGSNSEHLVVVRYDSEWLFFDNVVWTPFTPAEDDRILAEVAFQQTAVADQNDPEKLDVITDLKGSLSAIFGIPAGYSTGDLEFTPDRFGAGEGVFNNGELKASGTFFEVASNDAGEEPEIVEPNGAGFSLETIATGLLQPTSFAVAPDGRIFVAEKKGRIKIVENGQVVSTFLSITNEVASVGDRGLIGLTLDPDFENNGHVYYHYTVLDPDGDGITPDEDGDGRVEGVGGAVERVTVSTADPLVADMSTRVTVLDGHRMTGSTHSVGDIDFDNDGNLIFTWGDGGFGDIRLEAQDPNSVQGKLFRIDPVTLQGVSGNPFFDVENPDSVASKVWALGLRNSWKLTVDRATGDVYMGEVTDRGPEEINVVRADGSTELNFGWPYYEGDNVKDSYADQIPEGFTFELPFLNLPHLDLGFGDAITGGAVYRGDAYPEVYNGRYFFGSIVPGLFYTADQEGDFQQFGALGEYGGIGDIQLGPDGHIWTMSLFTGTISRLVFDPEAAAVIPPTISATQSQSAGESAVTVQFDATASTAIDGDLTFAWDFDSDGIVDSTDPTATHTFTTLGKTVTTLTVTDSVDASSSQLFETTVLESADATNLALGKATTQSETAFGGLSSRAVDGNVDGVFASESVALTTASQFTLWEVDLGEVYDITSIDIFERTDPSGTRLENFVVLISELPFTAANLEAVTADPGVVAFNFDDMDDLLTIVDETDGLLGRGQFVRIQLALDEHDLALAEVRVFGDSIVEDPTPTITQEGDTIFVQATDNDEVVELTLGETVHVLSINETEFTFDANVIKAIRIDAGLGFDKVMVNGTSAVERVRIIEADGTLTSSEFSVSTFAFDETHYIGNGGNDYAEIFGSSANDRLQALPEDATLTTPDNVIRAEDFPRIDSYGRGGYDYGSIYGTQVDDLYFMRDNYALMSGGGVINYTKGFERVDAFGRGGNDRAQLYDSESNDLFVALPTHAYVSNGSRISYTKGFERVDAFSVEGGNDRAVFYDDALTTETFTSRTNYAFMRNSSFLNYASNFAIVDAISTGGGDTASFYEVTTPTLLFARDDVFQLIGAGRDDSATGFASILAEADEEETPTTDVVDIDFVLDLVGTWI